MQKVIHCNIVCVSVCPNVNIHVVISRGRERKGNVTKCHGGYFKTVLIFSFML